MVADDVEHAYQQFDSLDLEDTSVIKHTEQLMELSLVLAELALYDFVALEVGQSENHVGTGIAVTFDYRFDEVNKVISIFFVELDHHAHINDVDLNLISASPQQVSDPLLFVPAGRVELFESGTLQEVEIEFFLELAELLADVLFDLAEESKGLFSNLY